MADAEQTELADIKKIERKEAFEAFVQSPFFAEDFVPLVEKHFAMWLDAVMGKRAPVETLEVLRGLMNDIDQRIDIGKRASQRLLFRRYGKLPGMGKG